jgi:hypothetical protein
VSRELLTKPEEKLTGRPEPRKTRQDNLFSRQTGQDRILRLEGVLGNRRVAELIRLKRITLDGRLVPVQTKLTVGAADDQYEQEAEGVAQQIVTTPESAVKPPISPEASQAQAPAPKQAVAAVNPLEHREPEKQEEPEEEAEKDRAPLQRESSRDSNDSFEAGADVETQLNSSKGRGSPLPDHVRTYMETRFGADFGHIRIHMGTDSAKMNEAVGAQAFTYGSEIYYGSGHSPDQLKLTAHELTHVVQHTGGIKQRSVQRDCEECETGGALCPKCAAAEEKTLQRSAAVADANAPKTLSGTAPSTAASAPGAAPANLQSTPTSQAAPNSSAGPNSQVETNSPVSQGSGQLSAAKQSGMAADSSSRPNPGASQSVAAGASPAGASAADAPSHVASAPSAASSSAAGAKAAPAPKLDTASADNLLTSLAAIPASEFGQALGQAMAAAPGIEAKEKADLAASLPEIDQPTGLPVKGEEKQAPMTALLRGRAPAPAPTGPAGAAPKTSDATPPVASGPLPAAHVSTAAPEPADDSGGSWWDWLFSKVRNFVSGLPTSDPSLLTSAGPRPTVDLTGDADPGRNAEYQQSSEEEITAHGSEADAATNKDFGERGIYPTVKTQRLRAKSKLSGPAGGPGSTPQKPKALPAGDLAEFDAGATPLIGAQVEEQAQKHRQDQEAYHKKSAEERTAGDKRIAEETNQARIQQESLRTQARADVDTGREQWRKENRKIQENFSSQSSAKHVEIDKQIKEKVKTADDRAETELANAEKSANEERTKAEAKAEAKKKEAEDRPKSWWERVKGAVSDAFDAIKDAINSIFDELRSLVKSIIDKAKRLVTGLIELARSAIVGLIKAFGEFVKGLVSIALAAFPEAAAKARAWIDDKVDKATAAVNKAAEVLKAAAQAILDAVGAVLDTALAVLQAAFNAVFHALEFIAKLALSALEALGKLVDLLTHFGDFLDGAKKIMDNPSIITDGIKNQIGKMIAEVPSHAASKLEELSAKMGGEATVTGPKPAPAAAKSGPGPATQGPIIQRSPDPSAAAPAKRHVPASVHLKEIWRHLTAGLDHLKSSWWEELKKVGWNLLWPWPAVWGDLKDIWKQIKDVWAAVKSLKASEAIDGILAIGQKINSILGNLYGWFFIASVLIGTIIGAFFGGAGAVPGFMAGVAFAGEVGEGLLVSLLAVEGGIIVKAIADLMIGNDSQQKDEADYDKIGGSTLTLAVTGAMMLIGEVAAKLAKSVWEGATSLLKGEKAPEVGVKLDVPEGKGGTPDKVADADKPSGTGETPELIDGERITAQSQDGHIKVTESGRCLICSTCEEIGIKYRDEITPGSKFEKDLNKARGEEDPQLKKDAIEKLEKELSEARQKAREGETPEQKTKGLADIKAETYKLIEKIRQTLGDPKNAEAFKADPAARTQFETDLRNLDNDFAKAAEGAKGVEADGGLTDLAREEFDNVRTKAEMVDRALNDKNLPSREPEATGPATGPRGEFWEGLDSYRGRTKTNGAGAGKRFYEWDFTHGDVEVYDSRGNHVGSADPNTGAIIKPAVKGRTINI